MADRKKVINCLTDIENIMITRQEICPREELQYWIELQEGVADAIELLKEHEAVEPIRINTNYEQHWKCGNCKAVISVQDKYCHECGKRIEWEGR